MNAECVQKVNRMPVSNRIKYGAIVEQIVCEKPHIVCLCGSTKYSHAFRVAAQEETLKLYCVFSIGVNLRENPEILSGKTEHEKMLQKNELVRVHYHKILLADEVLILNIHGIIGEDTQNEIDFAISVGKPVRYLVPLGAVTPSRYLQTSLQDEIAAWASVHLPHEADSLVKLQEELDELALSPADPNEIGDLIIGLMHHASKHGINALAAAADKFEIVKTRQYKMQPDGTCRHC